MAKIKAAKKGEEIRSYPLENGHGYSKKIATQNGIVVICNDHETINGGCFIPLEDLERELSAFYDFK